MDCADVREALRRGDRPSDADTSAHVAECPTCVALLEDDAALGRRLGAALPLTRSPAAETLESLLGATQARLARERGPVAWLRSRSTPARVLFAVSAVVLLALVQLVRPRADLVVYPSMAMILEVMLYGLVAGAMVPLVLRQLHVPAASPAKRLALVAAGLLVPFVLAARGPVHQASAASLAGTGPELVPRALACFGYGGAFAALLLLALWALERGAHRSWPAAVLSATLAGLAGNLVLHLHCPITHPEHLLLGHATVSLVIVTAYGAYRALFSSVPA